MTRGERRFWDAALLVVEVAFAAFFVISFLVVVDYVLKALR